MECIMNLAMNLAILGVLLVLRGVVGSKEKTALEKAPASTECRSTYYIHEYHVHGMGTDGVEEGDVIVRDSTGRPLIAREDLIRERAQWEEEVQELQARLVEERTERLNQMSHFVDWTRKLRSWDDQTSADVNKTALDSSVRLINEVANSLFEMMDKEKELLQRGRSDSNPKIIVREPPKLVTIPPTASPSAAAESWGKTRYAEMPKGRNRDKNSVLKEDHGDKGEVRNDDTDNATKNALLNELVGDLRREMTELQQTLDKVANKYLHLYKSNKRVALKQKRLERECRKSEGRVSRMHTYQKAQIRWMNWQLRNESELWQEGIKNLHLSQLCLQDTGKLCTDRKETKPVALPERVTSKPETLVEYTGHSQNDTPMTEGQQNGKADGENKDGDGRIQVTTSSRGHMTSEMMVEAGVKVSQWYMDQVIAQRPKGKNMRVPK